MQVKSYCMYYAKCNQDGKFNGNYNYDYSRIPVLQNFI